MMFQGKIDRVFGYFRGKHEKKEETLEEMPLEKGDFLAMVISALIVIVPAALAALAALGVIGYLFFFH